MTTPDAFLMFGLSHGDTDQSIEDIDYAIYTHKDLGEVCVFESGAAISCLAPYVAGDVLRVAVENGQVTYRQNGTLLYTSSVPPTYPLIVDTALNTAGGQVGSAVMAGELGRRWTGSTCSRRRRAGTRSRGRAGRAGMPEVRRRGRWCPGTGTRSTR